MHFFRTAVNHLRGLNNLLRLQDSVSFEIFNNLSSVLVNQFDDLVAQFLFF